MPFKIFYTVTIIKSKFQVRQGYIAILSFKKKGQCLLNNLRPKGEKKTYKVILEILIQFILINKKTKGWIIKTVYPSQERRITKESYSTLKSESLEVEEHVLWQTQEIKKKLPKGTRKVCCILSPGETGKSKQGGARQLPHPYPWQSNAHKPMHLHFFQWNEKSNYKHRWQLFNRVVFYGFLDSFSREISMTLFTSITSVEK